MTPIRAWQARFAEADPSTLLRSGVLALAGFGVLGLLAELAFLRHWSSAGELIVWPTLAAAGLATVVLAFQPTRTRVLAIRWIAVAVAVLGVVGMWFHVTENLTAGPLDRNFAATWDGLSTLQQWFLAVTGGVGPAPALAPGSISEVALAIILATLRHPALAEARRPV